MSSIGLGTYLGRADAPTDLLVQEAVRLCLTSGRVNVVDTAINYRHQRAERSIGRALSALFEAGSLRRDQVFVATKNGYLAPDGEAGIDGDAWIEQELLRPGVLRPSEIVDGSNAMSPRFLDDQLERSRANLGLGTIDLVYLHNVADAQLPVLGREEFFGRLRAAFELYERRRTEGKLQFYGLATWEALRVPRLSPGYVALTELVALAREVGGEDHGFRFVQFPFNLVMAEAATVRNQPTPQGRATVFEAGARLGVGTFTSVPLAQGQLARRLPLSPGISPVTEALQFARSAPGTIGALVGQKSAEHLAEDLAVAAEPPWSPTAFAARLS